MFLTKHYSNHINSNLSDVWDKIHYPTRERISFLSQMIRAITQLNLCTYDVAYVYTHRNIRNMFNFVFMRHLPSDWVGIANAWMPTLILNVAHAVQPAASYVRTSVYTYDDVHMYYMGAGWVDPRSSSRGNFFLLLNIWRAEL